MPSQRSNICALIAVATLACAMGIALSAPAAATTATTATNTINYCNPSLCNANVTHVACNSNTGLQSTCPAHNATQLPASQFQTLIVNLHNQLRSQLATGKVSGFKTASKMPQLQWDNNLAYVAGFNARSCVFAHDKCHNTPSYPMAGQNIAVMSSTGGYMNTTEVLTDLINDWFDEYKNANMTLINEFEPQPGPETGHFTAMAQQKSGHIGCAVVNYHGPTWYQTYLVCNYQYTNVIGEQVYAVGSACSACPTGTSCSTTHPGLCA